MLRHQTKHPFALSEVEVQLPHGVAFDCAQAEREVVGVAVIVEVSQ